VDAIFVAGDPFFASRRDQIVALAARHAIPAIYDRQGARLDRSADFARGRRRGDRMKRRDFITLLGGAAAAWPLVARGQQPATPVVGYLSVRTLRSEAPLTAAFRQGLSAGGFAEGQNVSIEYRFADGRYEQVPAMAADLVRRQVAVIFAGGGTADAAKASTATIPIVFSSATDPVQSGLVTSLSRPGANITGVSNLSNDVSLKRLQVMHDLIPSASVIGFLFNPANPGAALMKAFSGNLQTAAASLGLELHVLNASSEGDFEPTFARLKQLRAGALLIGADAYFTSRIERLAGLALRHGMPASYLFREFAAAGGLMSYGGSISEGYRLAGTCAARILKGEKPGDLPVQQSTKIEFVINLNTAKTLGLTVPQSLLLAADEVIE
jgi:putative ABC transport system substrate-binding protein